MSTESQTATAEIPAPRGEGLADAPGSASWQVGIIGPDEWLPYPDEITALREANATNAAIYELHKLDPDNPNRPFSVAIVVPPNEPERSYNQLIMAVARKFDGETRHETALRYIQQAEQAAGSGDACSESPMNPPNI